MGFHHCSRREEQYYRVQREEQFTDKIAVTYFTFLDKTADKIKIGVKKKMWKEKM